MHALEVQRNGITLVVVGASNALMFSADVSATIEEEASTIDVRGMIDLGNDRKAHTNWLELEPLQVGEQCAVKVGAYPSIKRLSTRGSSS